MEYSNYLSNRVKAQGAIQLSAEQFSGLFNLVFLEAQREAFKTANQIAAKTESEHKYDIQIYEADQFIRQITKGQKPEEFIPAILKKNQ